MPQGDQAANAGNGTDTQQTAATGTGSDQQTDQQSTATGTDQQQQQSETQQTNAATDDPTTWTFEMPEGVEIAQDDLGKFTTLAGELKLSKEQADKLVALEAGFRQAAMDRHLAQVAAWADEVRNDKELGGADLEKNVAIARGVAVRFGGEQTIKVATPTPNDPNKVTMMNPLEHLLHSTGYGNHPALVRLFYQFGKAISEDGFVPGTAPGSKNTQSLEHKLYPTMR